MALLTFWADAHTHHQNLWQDWQACEGEDEREREGEAAFGNGRKKSQGVRRRERAYREQLCLCEW